MEIKTRCKKKSQLISNLNGVVLFQDKTYSIEIANTYKNNGLNKKFELVIVVNKWYTNWVMVYPKGNVAYDFHVTPYINELVKKFALRFLDVLRPPVDNATD